MPHTKMKNQPTKDEVPFYAQHESGWYFCDRRDGSRLAELDFIQFQRPYFVFKVKFLTQDELIRESMFNPIKHDPNDLDMRYFLLNRKSGDVIDMKSFLTSRIGETNTVTLSDRRRPRVAHGKFSDRALFWIIRFFDILSFNVVIKAIKKRKAK